MCEKGKLVGQILVLTSTPQRRDVLAGVHGIEDEGVLRAIFQSAERASKGAGNVTDAGIEAGRKVIALTSAYKLLQAEAGSVFRLRPNQ